MEEQTEAEQKIAAAVDKAIKNMESRLENDDIKLSVADFVRLVELRKGLEADGVREVTVRWVDGWTDDPLTEE